MRVSVPPPKSRAHIGRNFTSTMKNSRSLELLVAMMSAASGPWAGLAKVFKHAFATPKIRFSKRYPEQSSRQAMRGQRRAQGGPGIVLKDGVYVSRSV